MYSICLSLECSIQTLLTTVAYPDLELRGRGGDVLTFLSCWPFSPQLFLLFSPKIKGGTGPPGPSPGSATVQVRDWSLGGT